MALPQPAANLDPAPLFLATVADEITRETVRQVAGQLGWPSARVREGGVAAARELLRDSPAPAVLLVDTSDSEDPLAAMEALAEVCEPGAKVIALGQANDVALYRAMIRMGVSDYLVKPVSAEILADALRRAQQAGSAPAAAPGKAARLIAVLGARGGVGATSVAVSTAWALAHDHGQRTVLLDLDLQFGSAALSLDLEPGRGLREILSNPERIDSLLLNSAMTPVGDSLRVLSAEEPLDDEIQVAPAGVKALLDSLAQDTDAVVVEVPRRTGRTAREVLARADLVVLVTDLSLPALRDARRLTAMLKTAAKGEVLVVGNRIGGVPGEAPQADFAKALGLPIDVAIPADAAAAQAAAEHAKPLLQAAPKGPAAAELRRLAARLAGETTTLAPPEPEPLAWLKRVLGR